VPCFCLYPVIQEALTLQASQGACFPCQLFGRQKDASVNFFHGSPRVGAQLDENSKSRKPLLSAFPVRKNVYLPFLSTFPHNPLPTKKLTGEAGPLTGLQGVHQAQPPTRLTVIMGLRILRM